MPWVSQIRRDKVVHANTLRLGPLGSGVDVTATAADLNLVSGMALATTGIKKVAKVALVAASGNGGALAWANPEAVAIVVNRATIDVTTQSAGACTLDIGTAVNGTTSNDVLLDGLSVAATGTFDNISIPGSNGKPLKKVPVGSYVTGTVASGTVTGLVGNIYIEYFLA